MAGFNGTHAYPTRASRLGAIGDLRCVCVRMLRVHQIDRFYSFFFGEDTLNPTNVFLMSE